MDLIYIITFGILNHTYIIFERFKRKHQFMFFDKQKHQFVVSISKIFFFNNEKRRRKRVLGIELTADELFI